MGVEFTLFSVHLLHILLCFLDLPAGAINILIIFLGVMDAPPLLLFQTHTLSTGFKEASKDLESMSGSRSAILDGRNPRDIWMTWLLLLLLERQVLIKFSHIGDLLKLIRVTLNLLFQVLDTFSHALCDLQVVLHLLHGGTNLGLLQCIFGECLMCILKLPNLFLLQVDFSHFPVVVSKLLVIIIIGWLLIFLKLVDWFLALFLAIIATSGRSCVFLSHRSSTLVQFWLLLCLNHLLRNWWPIGKRLHHRGIRTLLGHDRDLCGNGQLLELFKELHLFLTELWNLHHLLWLLNLGWHESH